MKDGYAFEYMGRNWKNSSDEDWEIVMYTITGEEKFIGTRWIDGSKVKVFSSGEGYYAQTEVYLS